MEDEQQPKRTAEQDDDLKSLGKDNLCSESCNGRDNVKDQSRNFTSMEKSDKLKVQTRQGVTGGLDGYFYEINLLILSRFRGQRHTDKFYLTTNMDGIGAFDDIVLKYWHNKEITLILLQAKHVEDSGKNKITFEKFINPKSDKFYLGKYFRDYLINRRIINETSKDPIFRDNSQVKYIIYTNAILDENFNRNRIIEIDTNCILSTKSEENRNKVFKFSLDDKNSDLIAILENISRQERIKLLAKTLVKCIRGKLNYKNMMGNELFLTYHVFLAKTVIDVSRDVKIDKTKIKYREGNINHDFLNLDNEDPLERKLKEEILYEFAKDVILNKKSGLEMGDKDKQNKLLNNIAELCAKKEAKLDEEIINNLGGSIIVLDTKERMLKFANEDKLEDESAKQFMRDLKCKVSNLADYKFNIPYELAQKTLLEQLKKKPLKLHIRFGNTSPDFTKQKHLIKLSLDDNGGDRTNVEEFLKVLEVFTGQASDQELRRIIKNEISDLYKLTETEIEDNYLKIKEKGENYWRMAKKDFLEKDDDFYEKILKFDIIFNVGNPLESFYGRVEQLQKLHQTLQSKGETAISQTASISGLGGIGKTELARKYAFDYRNFYDGNVIWINSESYETLAKSFRQLAQDKLGINEREKDIKSIVEEIYDFFSKRKSLFVFDNAEKRRNQVECDEGLDYFLPLLRHDAKKPYILITSRNQIWGDIEVIQLGTFSDTEATNFIKKELKINDDSQKYEIQKLLKILQQFPLALRQAVTYIKQTSEEIKNVMPEKEFKIGDYLREYEIKTKELLNFPFPDHSSDKYSRTTFTTFQVSTDKLKKKEHGKKALEILEIIAYCEPDNIPIKMFLPSEVDDAIRELGATVQLLKQYSLVNFDNGVLSVHRLVQEVTRINLIDEKRDEDILRKALESLKSYDLKIREFELKTNFLGRNEYMLVPRYFSDREKHASYIWSYASDYPNLIKDCYTSHGLNKNTPIHLFATNGKTKAIESILNSIQCKSMQKANEYNEFGYAPIHLAAFNGHKNVVEYLIEERGVGVNHFTNGMANTPVFLAIIGKQLHMLQYLLSEKKADPNIRNEFDQFPIHCAAQNARIDLIECLVNNNASINLKNEIFGNNVLHCALLHLTICNDTHLLNIEDILKYFLEKDPNLLKDENVLGMTPLHLASMLGYPSIVKMFLDYGADVNITATPSISTDAGKKTYNYRLSQFLLVEIHYIDSKKLNLLNNIEIYSKGYTPLRIAVEENHYEVVKILQQKGAIFNVTTTD